MSDDAFDAGADLFGPDGAGRRAAAAERLRALHAAIARMQADGVSFAEAAAVERCRLAVVAGLAVLGVRD